MGNVDTCEVCGYQRSPIERPLTLGQAFWRQQVPGMVGSSFALVRVEGRLLLLVPWTQRPEYRPATGGIVALDAYTGEEIWAKDLGGPVEAGVVVFADRALVPVHNTLSSGRIVALNLANRDPFWELSLPAAVLNTPTVVERRVHFATDDGTWHAVDALSGQELPGFPRRITEQPVPVRASSVLVNSGREETLVVCVYGRDFDRIPGEVIAVTTSGRVQWRQPAYGNVRAAPVAANRRLYVTAYRDHPSTGFLFALDTVTGQPVWEAPFQVQGESGNRRKQYFSASPLVIGDVVYVTSVNRHVYAVDALTGHLLWSLELSRSIATQPRWAHGMLLIAANDARVHAVDVERRTVMADAPISMEEDPSRRTELDSSTSQRWRQHPQVYALTQPLLWGEVLFAAATDGTVAALPWHLGQYAWAAKRFLKEKQFLAAGDHFALAAFSISTREERERYFQQAVDVWQQAEHHDRVGALRLAQGKRKDAAAAFLQAGYVYRYREPQRALAAVRRAVRLYERLHLRESVVEAIRLLSGIADLPFVRVDKFNAARYRLWEHGLLELKVSNEGASRAQGLRLRLGGSLERSVELTFDRDLPANEMWIVPLQIVSTQEHSRLDVEAIYGDEQEPPGNIVLPWSIPLEAERPPVPPPEVKIGDVAHMEIMVGAATREGVRIHTQDVGMIRGTQIEDVHVEGDAGAVFSSMDEDAINIQSNAGLVRKHDQPAARVCSRGHVNPPDARFCSVCGEELNS